MRRKRWAMRALAGTAAFLLACINSLGAMAAASSGGVLMVAEESADSHQVQGLVLAWEWMAGEAFYEYKEEPSSEAGIRKKQQKERLAETDDVSGNTSPERKTKEVADKPRLSLEGEDWVLDFSGTEAGVSLTREALRQYLPEHLLATVQIAEEESDVSGNDAGKPEDVGSETSGEAQTTGEIETELNAAGNPEERLNGTKTEPEETPNETEAETEEALNGTGAETEKEPEEVGAEPEKTIDGTSTEPTEIPDETNKGEEASNGTGAGMEEDPGEAGAEPEKTIDGTSTEPTEIPVETNKGEEAPNGTGAGTEEDPGEAGSEAEKIPGMIGAEIGKTLDAANGSEAAKEDNTAELEMEAEQIEETPDETLAETKAALSERLLQQRECCSRRLHRWGYGACGRSLR